MVRVQTSSLSLWSCPDLGRESVASKRGGEGLSFVLFFVDIIYNTVYKMDDMRTLLKLTIPAFFVAVAAVEV